MYRDTRPEMVGRASELELIRRFLASAEQRTRALVLHGEAGIGKTMLWRHTAADTGRIGDRVVSTRPTEAEARLPFAALNDLFADLLDEVQPALPAPQRAALDVALLRVAASGPGPEPLAIGLGLLGLIRAAVERAGLTIAIDDVQWLDASTASVLEFALRRLDAERVTVLAAVRTTPAASDPRVLPVVRAIHRDRLYLLEVAPLSTAEVDRLIAATVGLHLAPPVTRRIREVSRGNPFYALEMARALQRRGSTSLADDLPLPDSLSALVRDRLTVLSPAARHVAAYASALAIPDRETLAAALGEEAAVAGLRDAAAAEVLTGAGEVRFAHPLLAAEAYAALGARDRREIHRRLASVVVEAEERARHLAIATDGPDEEVAKALEDAARHAGGRGAPDAAADLAQRAAELSPADEARHRRSMAAARYRILAGEPARAQDVLDAALAGAADGNLRAEALMRLGEVRLLRDDWGAAGELLREALRAVHHDPRLEIAIKLLLVGVSFITGRDWDDGVRHIEDAMALAERLGDPRVLAGTIGHYATWRAATGHPRDPELERRAGELDAYTDGLRTMEHPDYDFARLRRREGAMSEYRLLLERLAARAERTGDYASLPYILAIHAPMDFWDGRIQDGLAHLDEADRLARATGQRSALAHVLQWRTFLAARTGQADAARDYGARTVELIRATGWRAGEAALLSALAELELSGRQFDRADAILRQVVLDDGANAWHAPAIASLRSEALVGLGRTDDAAALLDRYAPLPSVATERPADAEAIAAHALVAAGRGDLESATRLVAAACAIAERHGDRWRLARASLFAADIHRRGRRRAAARDALLRAIELFETLGAATWAANARQQLARHTAAGAGLAGLTRTQAEVAQLAARGLTNRQVGDRLFMSPHTVEAHLSAAYRTLGIRSRGELPRALEGLAGPAARDSAADLRDSPGTHGPEVEGRAEFR